MSETKAAFAERTILSFKNILYRFMENYDTSTFTNCLNSSDPWIPENVAQ